MAAVTPGCATPPEKVAGATLEAAWNAARAGDLDRGAELARQAEAERPGFVDPYFLLAAIDEKRGDFDSARESYRSILALDPTATRAAVALAGTFTAQKRFAEAEDWLLRAIEEDPGAEPAAYNLGELADGRGAPDDACAWFRLSSALDRRDPRAPTRLAVIRLRQGRLDEARHAAEDAVARAPTYPPAQSVLRAVEARTAATPPR